MISTVQNVDELLKLLRDRQIESVTFVGSDLHGIARGKHIPVTRLLENPQVRVNMSSFMVMMDCAGMPHDPPSDSQAWWPSWEEGFTDLNMIPDFSTARIVPWQDQTALVICDFEHAEKSWKLDFMPRALLKRLEDKALELGFTTSTSVELEWLLYRETEDSAFQKGYRDMDTLAPTAQCYSVTRSGRDAPIVQPIRRQLQEFGMPIEVWSAEFGLGMQEFNFSPEPAVAAGDTGFILKHAVRELASQNDLFAIFMAKTSKEGFGSGMHINQSLWKDGEPAFYDADKEDLRSTTLKQAVAGQLATLKDFTLLYCPTPNSYRRFAAHYSTGHLIGWGHDNKSIAVRTVVDTPSSTRIEQRTAGGDANPYLAIAAGLAGMLHGIESKLEPPAPIFGDGYANESLESVPTTMGEAIEAFENSELANKLLGEDFVRFFTHTRKMELQLFEEATEDLDPDEISGWEMMRYADTV